ncbi:hypothetical protein HaLaN_20862, partial [Haematococcus lacustris]
AVVRADQPGGPGPGLWPPGRCQLPANAGPATTTRGCPCAPCGAPDLHAGALDPGPLASSGGRRRVARQLAADSTAIECGAHARDGATPRAAARSATYERACRGRDL